MVAVLVETAKVMLPSITVQLTVERSMSWLHTAYLWLVYTIPGLPDFFRTVSDKKLRGAWK